MGDPAGVGPAVVVCGLARARAVARRHRVVVLGDPRALERARAAAGLTLPLEEAEPPPWSTPPAPRPGAVAVAWPRAAHGPLSLPGRATAAGGRAQIAYVDAALEALRGGQSELIVTGPVSKAAISRSGVPFSGHTEHLARAVGVSPDGVTMLFAGPTLRVALATTHLPLRAVSAGLSRPRLADTIERVVAALRGSFGVCRPRVVVLGLNPHAGEDGLLGDEERRIVAPAVALARRRAACRGAELHGPVPTEAGLRLAIAGRYDCAVALYHDQATVPCKLLDMGRSVNVTLGLPFVRTSVDHGVAYDAAAAGTADCGSMVAALELGSRLARSRARGRET